MRVRPPGEPAPLPVDRVAGTVLEALAGPGCFTLVAPPGSGKTTRLPIRILEAPWMADSVLLLLEPRRVAARAAAARLSAAFGEAAGGIAGYRVRGESRIGPRTRIEVVTEAVLIRILQSDPGLGRYGCILFDEFHERSLQADLGLALALESRAILRPDLRIGIMSATLDQEPVRELLPEAVPIVAHGSVYPVAIRHRERPLQGSLEEAIRDAAIHALGDGSRGLLAFLPGAGEIERTRRLLEEARDSLPRGTRVLPLHGSLPQSEQDVALAPPAPDAPPRVVLATDLAETSVTIEGIDGVMDGGFARVPRFDPSAGVTRLVRTRISRDSADQRAGRAGRTGPGWCLRLWTAAEHASLPSRRVPEILQADLAGFALELAQWGVTDPSTLRWIDPPPSGAMAAARELLAAIGAVDGTGRITPHGRRLVEIPLHPRLAHMLLLARSQGEDSFRIASEASVLLEDRDPLARAPGDPVGADFMLRLDWLRGAGGRTAQGRRVLEEARRLRDRIGAAPPRPEDGVPLDPRDVALLLLPAWPDRIARRRGPEGSRYRLSGGRGAVLPPGDPLAREEWILTLELADQPGDARVRMALPLPPPDLNGLGPIPVTRTNRIAWDEASGTVIARWEERIGGIPVRSGPLSDPPLPELERAWSDALKGRGWDLLPWTGPIGAIRARLHFLHVLDPDAVPSFDPALLRERAGEWLLPWLSGVHRPDEVAPSVVEEALLARLDPSVRAGMDRLAPAHILLPTGTRAPIDYSNPEAPVLAVRLQELFGWRETPTVGGGRIPLMLHLLSPAHRPVQVTRDLSGFWERGYPEVRRELRGRYPRHAWPEDPLRADPIRGPRPRG